MSDRNAHSLHVLVHAHHQLAHCLSVKLDPLVEPQSAAQQHLHMWHAAQPPQVPRAGQGQGQGQGLAIAALSLALMATRPRLAQPSHSMSPSTAQSRCTLAPTPTTSATNPQTLFAARGRVVVVAGERYAVPYKTSSKPFRRSSSSASIYGNINPIVNSASSARFR